MTMATAQWTAYGMTGDEVNDDGNGVMGYNDDNDDNNDNNTSSLTSDEGDNHQGRQSQSR